MFVAFGDFANLKRISKYYSSRINALQNIQRDGFGGFDAVNSGGENSARVACAFACGEKSVSI
jgi:hypothetical protein